MIPIFGLIIGLLIGIIVPYAIPGDYSVYAAVAILALIDSVFGGAIAVYQGRFEIGGFVTEFLGNAAVALALAFIGRQMDVPLYLAPVFAFGNRLFENMSTLRKLISSEHDKKREQRRSRKNDKKKMSARDSIK